MPVPPNGLPRPRPKTRRAGLTARQSASRRVRRPFFHAVIIAIAIATAFYASFLPSRLSSRANSLANPADGLSFSGAIVAQPLPEKLSYAVSVEPRTAAVSSLSPRILSPSSPAPPAASSQLSALAPDSAGADSLRISAAGTTPQAGDNAPDATPTPEADNADEEDVEDKDANDEDAEEADEDEEDAKPPDPDCRPAEPASNLYCVYTIKSGDTLSRIAAKFSLKGNEDVAPWQLLVQSNKPDIATEDDILQPGQNLRIPTGGVAVDASGRPAPGAPRSVNSSAIHTVLRDETLSDIADEFGVSVSEIVSANNLSNPDRLSIGQELLINNPKSVSAPAVAAAPAASGSSSSSGSGSGASGTGAQAAATGPRSSAGFIWPTSGPISSYYSASHPLGIDIDLFANPNAPIATVAAGTVTFAGGSSCCSYGLYVVVEHANGMSTVYAHLSQLSVSVGQKVSQGAIVGRGGRTGYATGNHLHFEVHRNGGVVNPLSYLP